MTYHPARIAYRLRQSQLTAGQTALAPIFCSVPASSGNQYVIIRSYVKLPSRAVSVCRWLRLTSCFNSNLKTSGTAVIRR